MMPAFPHRTELSIINLLIGHLSTNIIERMLFIILNLRGVHSPAGHSHLSHMTLFLE